MLKTNTFKILYKEDYLKNVCESTIFIVYVVKH